MMHMFADEIYKTAVKMCGEESDILGLLCQAAEQAFLRRLRDGVKPEHCREILIGASALLAVAMYGKAAVGVEGTVSYKAGEVEVKRESSAETLSASDYLQLQAEQMMAPYITDGGFSFLGVRG
jgi:hypothetical protein